MDARPFDHIGDEDLVLMLQLLRQDSREALSAATRKGKQLQGTETDSQLAFNLFQEELQKAETISADRRMTRSMQNAIQVDGDVLQQSQSEEQIAEDDHNLSLSLANGETGLPARPSSAQNSMHDDELIEALEYLYVKGIGDTDSDNDSTTTADQAEGSASASSRQGNWTRRRRQCDACIDRKHFTELYKAPCQHEYCRDCLAHLFQDAMVDESLFPPRCCKQHMPLEKCRFYLNSDIPSQFREKALEFSTPDRTYCHNTNCGSFIPPTNCAHTTATCSKCHSETCTMCKGALHGGDCPNDEQLQQVLQLAREQGWQRCQSCSGMVELNIGCNHMT